MQSLINNKIKVSDINEASRQVGYLLQSDLGLPIKIIDINQGRYKIFKYQDEAILIAFKREMYLTFEEGRGETINEDDLNEAIKTHNIKRVFIVYSDSKIYVVSPYTIKAQGIQRETEAEGKRVLSFPVRCLIRFNDFKEVIV